MWWQEMMTRTKRLKEGGQEGSGDAKIQMKCRKCSWVNGAEGQIAEARKGRREWCEPPTIFHRAENLGTDVVRRSDGHVALDCPVLRQPEAGAKVGEPDVAGRVDQHVVRLDVPVDVAQVVDWVDCQNLRNESDNKCNFKLNSHKYKGCYPNSKYVKPLLEKLSFKKK